ncbi:hypothetical protein EIP86_007608 [Pleurotus ostreatoroseus]|nr:hypothetical protein EIP86_007608 [Pleurotus ostreatoroseus]
MKLSTLSKVFNSVVRSRAPEGPFTSSPDPAPRLSTSPTDTLPPSSASLTVPAPAIAPSPGTSIPLFQPCHIDKLCDDVLIMIFNEVTAIDYSVLFRMSIKYPWDYSEGVQCAMEEVCRLAAVSRHWRAVMLSVGTLWAAIRLDREMLTEIFAARSKGSLLNVSWTGKPTDKMTGFIEENSHRIVAMTGCLWSRSKSHYKPERLLHLTAPELLRISLRTFGYSRYSPPTLPESFMEGLPKLRSLALIDLRLMPPRTTFPNVVTLSIDGTLAYRVVIVENEILRALKCFPFLQSLQLTEFKYRHEPTHVNSLLPYRKRIQLDHLRDAKVHLTHEVLLNLLGSIAIPESVVQLDIATLLDSTTELFDLVSPNHLRAELFTSVNTLTINTCKIETLRTYRLEYKAENNTLLMDVGYLTMTVPSMCDMMKRVNMADVTHLCIQTTVQGNGTKIPDCSVDAFDFLTRLTTLQCLEYYLSYRSGVWLYNEHWKLASILDQIIEKNETSKPAASKSSIKILAIRVDVEYEPGFHKYTPSTEVWRDDALCPLVALCKQFPTVSQLILCTRGGSYPDEKQVPVTRLEKKLRRLGLRNDISVCFWTRWKFKSGSGHDKGLFLRCQNNSEWHMRI